MDNLARKCIPVVGLTMLGLVDAGASSQGFTTEVVVAVVDIIMLLFVDHTYQSSHAHHHRPTPLHLPLPPAISSSTLAARKVFIPIDEFVRFF